MSSNIYDFKKIQQLLKAKNQANIDSLNPDTKFESDLNMDLLLRALSRPDQRVIFEQYVKRMADLSEEFGLLTKEFNEAVVKIIEDENNLEN